MPNTGTPRYLWFAITFAAVAIALAGASIAYVRWRGTPIPSPTAQESVPRTDEEKLQLLRELSASVATSASAAAQEAVLEQLPASSPSDPSAEAKLDVLRSLQDR